MPYEIRRCIAPHRDHPSVECGKEFVALSENKKYCSLTCANRAHKRARKDRDRGRGYGARDPNPNQKTPSKLASIDAYKLVEAIFKDETVLDETLAALPSSEDGLRSLGYGGRRGGGAGGGASPPPARPKPDRSAEPRKLPRSDAGSPPDFGPYDDPEPVDPSDL